MTNPIKVPFHLAYLTRRENAAIEQVLQSGDFGSEGFFAKKCETQLRQITGAKDLVLTPSCTDALEMAALLCDIVPGDEVVMPSFTFVSSANPFVLRGARIIFADIDPRTMNLDPDCVEKAISEKTKAVVVTHYGGVSADMEKFAQLTQKQGLWLIEDAAHCIGATWKGRHIGTVGHLGALSFHSSKNVHCAEGGALLVNDARLAERAAILRNKGTNRDQFLSGQVGQYTWVDVGSSFTMSELNAAFLSAQLEDLGKVNAQRLQIWNLYAQELEELAHKGFIELAVLSTDIQHNAHIFFLKCKNRTEREALIHFLAANGVDARFHYIPLHTATAGLKYGQFFGKDKYTTRDSERLLRLPIYPNLEDSTVLQVAALIRHFYIKTS